MQSPQPAPPLDSSLFDLEGRLWLAHCMEGPMTRAAGEALAQVVRKELRPWEMRWEEDFLGVQAQLRQACAELLKADPSDISLTHSTSAGLITVASGFPWKPGDEVLLPLGEFPSNFMPWKALGARGVVCREVALWAGQKSGPDALHSAPPGASDPDLESVILGAIGPKTRMVGLSWARFQDGIKLDLERIAEGCQARGVHLVVDGIQGMGTHTPSLKGVSAFASAGHKGLLGPTGQGFLWTHPDFRPLLAPTGTWLSRPSAFSQGGNQAQDPELWAADGRRLEPGGASVLGCAALNQSVRVLLQADVGRIESHVSQLQTLFLQALREDPTWEPEASRLLGLLEANRLGPTLCFHHGALGLARLEKLVARGLECQITTSIREGYLRIAFHGWHSAQDVERALEWLS
ncbi:MAG: aminotransferase class V-fold PLP-dependent enzyme [Meiothermus sp.]|nr:aminotransferase class V-fold PLP-dependent enzyme [Meiothermus sp.]